MTELFYRKRKEAVILVLDTSHDGREAEIVWEEIAGFFSFNTRNG